MIELPQEMPQTLRGWMFCPDGARPKERRILALKTGVAGLKYHMESEDERAALERLVPGTELLLFREPENEHDEWAVAVYLNRQDKIGFITRFKNETIARLMDAGKRFVGVVDDPETDSEAKTIVEKELRRSRHAPTENMALPVSIYLIEEA